MTPAHLLCPYCFSQFSADALRFRCVDPARCGTIEDVELTEYQYGKVDLSEDGRSFIPLLREGRIFGAKPGDARRKGIPLAAKCPHCHLESNKLICPQC